MSEKSASEDDTVKIKRPRDLVNVLVGVGAFAMGGASGSAATLAVTKHSVDRLTTQVEKLESKVEALMIGQVSQAELLRFEDRFEKELDKLREELRRSKQ